MQQKILLWALWLGFIAYAVFLAPPDSPTTWTLIQNLATGQFAGINPCIIALFNLMGVFPLIYGCLLYSDGRVQRIPAWVFAVSAFAAGAFALIPYLALRQPNGTFVGDQDGWLRIMDSRWLGGVIAIATMMLLIYGMTNGDWNDFVQQWRTSKFIHVMSWDFCLLCLLFPALLGDDMARRGLKERWMFWAVAGVPLLGAIAYLVLRPPLQISE